MRVLKDQVQICTLVICCLHLLGGFVISLVHDFLITSTSTLKQIMSYRHCHELSLETGVDSQLARYLEK